MHGAAVKDPAAQKNHPSYSSSVFVFLASKLCILSISISPLSPPLHSRQLRSNPH